MWGRCAIPKWERSGLLAVPGVVEQHLPWQPAIHHPLRVRLSKTGMVMSRATLLISDRWTLLYSRRCSRYRACDAGCDHSRAEDESQSGVALLPVALRLPDPSTRAAALSRTHACCVRKRGVSLAAQSDGIPVSWMPPGSRSTVLCTVYIGSQSLPSL